MIDAKMEQSINDQINAELFSSYLYLSMSAHFNAQNLSGLGNWMRIQAQEELFHAMKFHDYLLSRGGRVEFYAIEKPQKEWESALAIFEAAYAHEQYITGRINDMMDLAQELKDHASRSFLQWYVDEQVEEESNADGIVQQLRLLGDSSHGLLMIDRELGARPAKMTWVVGTAE